MLGIGKQHALSDAVASQLIGYDHARYILKALQQAPEESLRGLSIPPWLNEDVEHDAVLINGTPQIVLHSLDPDEHLVEVPFVSWPWPAAAYTTGMGLAELLAPAPHSLIGNHNASFSQNQLNIPQAEAEYVIEPDSMADDLSWIAMAVMRVGRWFHAVSLVGLQPVWQTRLI